MVSGLKKFTDPVSLLRFLDPLALSILALFSIIFLWNTHVHSRFLRQLSPDNFRHPALLGLCPDSFPVLWQQGPASFNITAKTDVCTLPINMPKLITMATGTSQLQHHG